MWKGSLDGWNDDGYNAAGELLKFIQRLENGATDGSGIAGLVPFAHNLIGDELPPSLVNYAVAVLYNLFGGYPHGNEDVVPSAIFLVVYFFLLCCHVTILIINFSRGHHFYMTLVWIFYCVLRVMGWAMRIAWAKDITKARMGLADEVFLILSSIILVTTNLILAQRLFTWRHPVGGSRKLFWNVMLAHYFVVALVIALTIVASAVPYLYFLSDHSMVAYRQVVQTSSVLIVLYTLTAAALIFLSYFFKPTTKDENLYTYQPWWIESFHPFYFVRKNAAQEAEETFMKRNHNHRHAIRVIASTHHHYNMVEGLTNERGTLKHNNSLLIIFFTTIAVFISSVARCVVTFLPKRNLHASPASNPIVAYMCWGFLEVIVNVLYLVGRVDLRFYRPDILPAKVRAIITAEQSFYPSDMESTTSGRSSDESLSFGAQAPSAPPPAQVDEKRYFPPPATGDEKLEKYEYEHSNDNASDFYF